MANAFYPSSPTVGTALSRRSRPTSVHRPCGIRFWLVKQGIRRVATSAPTSRCAKWQDRTFKGGRATTSARRKHSAVVTRGTRSSRCLPRPTSASVWCSPLHQQYDARLRLRQISSASPMAVTRYVWRYSSAPDSGRHHPRQRNCRLSRPRAAGPRPGLQLEVDDRRSCRAASAVANAGKPRRPACLWPSARRARHAIGR